MKEGCVDVLCLRPSTRPPPNPEFCFSIRYHSSQMPSSVYGLPSMVQSSPPT